MCALEWVKKKIKKSTSTKYYQQMTLKLIFKLSRQQDSSLFNNPSPYIQQKNAVWLNLNCG